MSDLSKLKDAVAFPYSNVIARPTLWRRRARATHLVSSIQENWVARIKRAMTGWGGDVRSKIALMLVFSLALGVASCGVKNDLVLPDGKPTPKGEKDPSKPPQQLGR